VGKGEWCWKEDVETGEQPEPSDRSASAEASAPFSDEPLPFDGDVIAPPDEPPGVPASIGPETLDELQEWAEQGGMSWPEFEEQILGVPWTTWILHGGSVESAYRQWQEVGNGESA
jgi:hypothetical protein